MIIIYDNFLGINIKLEGSIQEIPKKMNYSEIITIRGSILSESSRSVINLNLTINFLNETGYKKLQDIFLYGNKKLLIEDLSTGKTYNNYFIQGDTLNLESLEDVDMKKFYYKGGINLNKR